MVLLRNLILLGVLVVNLVSCEHKEGPKCIYTEGKKICNAAESAELSQSQDAQPAVLESGHPDAENTGSSLATEESAVNVKVTDFISNAGTEENNVEHAPDTDISDPTATNTSSQTSSDTAAQSRTQSVEESSPVVDEGNTSNQENSVAVDSNASIQVDSGEAGEVNVSKQENSAFSGVTNSTTRGSSVHDEANVTAQKSSVEISEANVSKQGSSMGVAEANTTTQENSVSNATMIENSPRVDEANTSKNADSSEAAEVNTSKQGNVIDVAESDSNKQDNSAVSTEANVNIDNSVVDAEGNALQGISANSSKQGSDILSNATSETQIPERMVAKNETLESASEGRSRPEALVTAEVPETADSSETRAQTGDKASSPSKEAIADISPPELVAVAEGIVMASTILQVATAKSPQAAILDPAHEVALAEGLEMADAVLQAVEDEPAVNAIWRATLEAESRMKQDNTPVNEETLDKGLMAFLVCVMLVLAITGSVSGWVLYTRLRRTPEEDQAQNMYILIDASDPQSNFVDCPLDLNDPEGNSYTFPRVQNDIFS